MPAWRAEFLNIQDWARSGPINTANLLEWFTWYEVRKTVGPRGRGVAYVVSVTKTRPFMLGHAENGDLQEAIKAAAQNALTRYDNERSTKRRAAEKGDSDG